MLGHLVISSSEHSTNDYEMCVVLLVGLWVCNNKNISLVFTTVKLKFIHNLFEQRHGK